MCIVEIFYRIKIESQAIFKVKLKSIWIATLAGLYGGLAVAGDGVGEAPRLVQEVARLAEFDAW